MSKFEKATKRIEKHLGSFAWAVADVGATVIILLDMIGEEFRQETGFVILWLAALAIYDKISKIERKVNNADKSEEDK